MKSNHNLVFLMKRLLISFAILLSGTYSQGQRFEGKPIQTPLEHQQSLDSLFSQYELYQLDRTAMNAYVKRQKGKFDLNLSLGTHSWNFELTPKSIFGSGGMIEVMSNGQSRLIKNSIINNYVGFQENPKNRSRFFISENIMHATIHEGDSKKRLYQLKDFFGNQVADDLYVLIPYSSATIPELNNFNSLPTLPTPPDCSITNDNACTVGKVYFENEIQRYIEMVAIADVSFYNDWKGNCSGDACVQNVKDKISSIVSLASEIYFDYFDVDLVINFMRIYEENDPYSAAQSTILSKMKSNWGLKVDYECIYRDVVHLFTAKDNIEVDGGSTGELNQICTHPYNSVSFTRCTGNQALWYKTVAHELAHGLGAVHIDNACDCTTINTAPLMCDGGGSGNLEFDKITRTNQCIMGAKIMNPATDCFIENDRQFDEEACEQCFVWSKIEVDNINVNTNCNDGSDEVEFTLKVFNNCIEKVMSLIRFSYTPSQMELLTPGDFGDFTNINPNLSNILEIYDVNMQPNEVREFKVKMRIIENAANSVIVSSNVKFNNDQSPFTPTDRVGSITIPIIGTYDIELNGTNSLSTLIGNGSNQFQPYNGNCSEMVSKNILINGTLIIDTDYCFNNSSLLMGAGAEIIVLDGNQLKIVQSLVKSECSDSPMWKGITVENAASLGATYSTIEDGQYAISAENGSNIFLRHTTFNNNYIGIMTPEQINGIQNNISFNLSGLKFQSDGDLKEPYLNQLPIPDELPLAGIIFNNLPFVSINLNSIHKTTFNNLANGIISNSSTLTLGNVSFIDIRKLANTTYPFSGRGVSATSNSSFHTLTHSFSELLDSQYEICDVGIFTDGMNVNLFDLTMNKVRTGIYIQNSTAKFLQVNDNTINATVTGIFLNDNSFNLVSEVKNNTINISVENPLTGGYGIRGADMINITSAGYGWDIENNRVSLNNTFAGLGIYYDMGSFNNYIGNSVYNSHGQHYVGYHLAGGSNNRVLCNSFDGSPSPLSTNSIKEGYHFSGTPQSDISCNEGSNTDKGIVIFGMSDNSLIQGNNIWDVGTGFQLGLDPTQGNAFIGEQLHQGNLWEIDLTPNDNNFGAVHFGANQDMILESRFEVDNTATLPNGIANRTFLPSTDTPNEPGVTWFDNQTGFSPYNCNITNTCPEGIGWHGFVDGGGITKLDEKIAQGNLSTDGYDASMNWIAKRHLFQKLESNGYDATSSTTPADFIISNFHTTESNTTIGQFNALDESINNVFILDATTESNLLNQRNNIENKLTTLVDLEEVIQSETLTNAELQAKLAEKENTLSALHSLDEAGVGFSDQIIAQRETNITNLLSNNSTIAVNYTYETNEKDLNLIYLTKKLNDEASYTIQDIPTINSIANQCPLSGGDAVYKARAMMASLSPEQTYDDIILCQQNDEAKRIGDSKEKNLLQLMIQPNPTADIIDVEVTTTIAEENRSALRIFIYNNIGQKIMEDEISYNKQKTYDVSSYDAGMYTVMIRNQEGIVMRSTKIIVISN